MSHLKTALEC